MAIFCSHGEKSSVVYFQGRIILASLLMILLFLGVLL